MKRARWLGTLVQFIEIVDVPTVLAFLCCRTEPTNSSRVPCRYTQQDPNPSSMPVTKAMMLEPSTLSTRVASRSRRHGAVQSLHLRVTLKVSIFWR